MSKNVLALLLLVACGAVLGTIAMRAKERTYTVPVRDEAVPFALAGDVPSGFTKVAFDVQGMCCQGCSAKLYGALLAVDGVSAAAVDPVLARAEALVRADVAPTTLEHALTFDKYTAHLR